MRSWRVPRQIWSGVVSRLPFTLSRHAHPLAARGTVRAAAALSTRVLTCDTCGEAASFALVDEGVSDDRWECLRCHAHRYETHLAPADGHDTPGDR
ncbi:MAG: hypothetical protein U0Q55_22675 [Vicinamibacterales bacterium]